MSKPDPRLLDRINAAWDDRTQRPDTSSSDADGYAEIIHALHQADHPAQPPAAFRRRLREEILARQDSAPVSSATEFEGAETQPASHRVPLTRRRNRVDDAMERRRWWFSHAGELAAMILILVVAVAGVALWQSDDGAFLPGATGDDAEQTEVVPTPEPVESGFWTGLTFEEAQIVTPFRLLMPEHVPEGYELTDISVRDLSSMAEAEDHHLEPREDDAPWVTVVFEFNSGDDNEPMIQLAQQNLRSPDMPVRAGQPDDVTGPEDHPGPATESVRGELTIDGIDIMHSTFQEMGEREREMFTWFQDGLTIHMNAPNEDIVPGTVIMEIIESIIAQRDNDDEPPVADGFGVSAEDEAVVEAEEAESAQPEIHRALSVEEAQEIVPYDLVDPRDAHPDYDLADITVSEPPLGDNYHTTFTMVHTEVESRTFMIMQQNSRMAIPSTDDLAGTPEGGPEEPVDTPDPVQQDVEIDGLQVTRTIHYNLGGDQLANFTWYQNATGVSVYAMSEIHEENINDLHPESAVPLEDLDAVVAHIVEQRISDEAPPEPEIPEPPEGHETPPDGGRTEKASLSEVREMAPFELIDLDLLPGELRFGIAELARFEDGVPAPDDHPEIEEPNQVRLHFASPPDSEPQQIVQVVQTADTIPNDEGEMIEVDGHPVEVVSGQMGTSFEQGWIWEVNGLEYGILITTINRDDLDSPDELDAVPPISEDDVLEIIASTLD